VARRKQETSEIPRGLSRWWVNKLVERGMTLEQAIETEIKRREDCDRRIGRWKKNRYGTA
jgi:hypothetical protein